MSKATLFYKTVFVSSHFNLHTNEPRHDKTNKMSVPSEDSDQPRHPPNLIRVFAVRMKKAWVLSYPLSAQRRLWSDWADVHSDLSLRWAHIHFVGFVMRGLILRLLILWLFIRNKSAHTIPVWHKIALKSRLFYSIYMGTFENNWKFWSDIMPNDLPLSGALVHAIIKWLCSDR